MQKLALFVALLPIAAAAQVREWRIDPAHSAANFSVRHMMVTNVRGQLGKIKGTAKFDPADPRTGSVEGMIDAAGIDTREPKRDAHLRSPDFLDTQKYPTITFKSKRVEVVRPGALKVVGDLTIRDVTKEVSLNVEGPAPPVAGRGGARSGLTATTTISRKDFGITWNRLIEAGGVTVGDEVNITIDLELIESKPTS
jgi:polyisoprenoid-binding protein YceI